MTRLWRNCGGAAAAELALILPLLLVLLMGPLELGNFFLDQHALAKGLRDGAVYAARQDISNYDCSTGSPTVPSSVVTATKNLVRTGQLSAGTDRLPNWTDASTTFTVTVACFTAASGTTLSGIYSANNGNVPVVTVSASLPYKMVLSNIGFNTTGLLLSASQQSAVTGI